MKFNTIWSEEDKEYVGICSEFPSLSHLSPDKNEALQGIKDLVSFVLNDVDGQSRGVVVRKMRCNTAQEKKLYA